jgi:hypothetical protein
MACTSVDAQLVQLPDGVELLKLLLGAVRRGRLHLRLSARE